MNELVFFGHLLAIVASLLSALYLGKEALIALISVFAVLMNLFVIKQITLFGLTVTATDAFAVGVTLGLNLLQEYYGKEITQKAIWISFFTSLVVIAMGFIHLTYIPAPTDFSNVHFQAILGFMPRIIIASLVTYFIVMQIDAFLYGHLKALFSDRFLIMRNYTSILTSQFIDTVLFSFLGLYGIVSSVGSIIAVSYTIKIIVILIATPFVALSKIFKK